MLLIPVALTLCFLAFFAGMRLGARRGAKTGQLSQPTAMIEVASNSNVGTYAPGNSTNVLTIYPFVKPSHETHVAMGPEEDDAPVDSEEWNDLYPSAECDLTLSHQEEVPSESSGQTASKSMPLGNQPTRTDSITGLSNEFAMAEWLRMMFALMTRYGHGFSLVLVDIDRLPNAIRLERNVMLAKVANLLLEAIRETDFVFRLTGFQFAILLPETDSLGAEVFARRVNRLIRQNLDIDVRLGISPTRDDDTTEKLLQRVRAAVRAGRGLAGHEIVRHDGQSIEAVATEISPATRTRIPEWMEADPIQGRDALEPADCVDQA